MATIASIRQRLLAECDALAAKARQRKDSNPKAGRGIREGVGRARDVIEKLPADGQDAATYLKTLRSALESEADALRASSDDDDGWDLGGVRSVINSLDDLTPS